MRVTANTFPNSLLQQLTSLTQRQNKLQTQAATGQIVHRLRGHRARPVALAFSPDGQRLATAGWDPEIKLWDIASGQEVLALRGHASDEDRRGIMALSFSRDGSLLASAGVDGTARIWSGADCNAADADSR